MKLYSKPVISVQGELTVPGDKSISHRGVIFGSIAKGETVLNNFLDGEDCIATINAFKSMGVRIEGPTQQQLLIYGVGKYGLRKPAGWINCGNSGTTMRLLAGILAAQSFTTELTGDSSLMKRPMERISYPLSLMGASIQTSEGKPPLKIQGSDNLKGICYTLPQASAQVKSCILLAGLYAKGKTTIIEPVTTRDHTEKMLKAFNYPIVCEEQGISINNAQEGNGTYFNIPGDFSSAAFFMVLGLILPESRILIRNVGINPTRTGLITILQQMGGAIELLQIRHAGEEVVADIQVTTSSLHGIVIPEELVPLAIDEFPILFIAAACAQGKTLLRGAKELRSKESDRIQVMANGLNTLGIQTETFEDGIGITGGIMQGGMIESVHDHRIAMAFIIAGAKSIQGITIRGCETIATSFPNFVKIANTLGLDIKEI